MDTLAHDMNGIFGNLSDDDFARGFIKALIERTGESINAIARKAGVSQSTAHAVINGKRGPSLKTYARMVVAATDVIIANENK